MKQVGGDHYTRHKDMQPWDIMEEYMKPEEFAGFLRGNVIQYTMRYKDKGKSEDLKKLLHYGEKLLETETNIELDKNNYTITTEHELLIDPPRKK